jgi:nucleoside-diphosphate-sugar epimerase
MSWPQVERMFAGVANMDSLRIFCLYGPFHYGGRPSSESNARFDAVLRSQDPTSGIRDFEHVQALAGRCGLAFIEDNAMPANNRLVVFKKQN